MKLRFLFFKDLLASLKNKNAARRKRSLFDEPAHFYVELLAVTDISTLEMHANIYGTNDTEFLHSVMTMYYIHLVHGVSERFRYSLRNESEFSVQIILTNILFLEDVRADGSLSHSLWIGDD